MTKTRGEKGITLIALIITIVVLLILAAVAISSIQNDGIISHANNSVTKFKKEQEDEQGLLDEYANYLETVNLGNAEVGVKVTKNSTINGEEYSATNPIIPAGFMPINTETSSWQPANEEVALKTVSTVTLSEETTSLASEVLKGLVISDGTNEFVWIPVEDINSFARLQEGSEINYRGVLYDFATDGTGKTEYTWSVDCTSYREPDIVIGSDGEELDEAIDNLSILLEGEFEKTQTVASFKAQLQSEFNAMVKSVAKYKGFYVGRYETSLNDSGVAQSKSAETPMNSINWYSMYANSKTYSTSNKNLGVVSEMIWGCQWDAMMQFLLDGADKSHVTVTTNVGHTSSNFSSYPYKTGGTNYTDVYSGTTNNGGYGDITANIYDLEGNVVEWTQTANDSSMRIYYGGSCEISSYMSNGGDKTPSFFNGNSMTEFPFIPIVPTETSATILGSRLSLYIK